MANVPRKFSPPDILELVDQVKPLFAGKHPATQGGALADLVAIFLAGHPPDVREALLEVHIATVRELTPINAAAIRGEVECPRCELSFARAELLAGEACPNCKLVL